MPRVRGVPKTYPNQLTVDDVLAAGTAHMAHRGNGSTHIDNCYEGFVDAFQSGHTMFDGGDLHLSTDNLLFNCHTTPITNELTGPGSFAFVGSINTPSLTASGFKQMKWKNSVQNAVYANRGDESTCTFEDICQLLRSHGGAVITPELKTPVGGTTSGSVAAATIQKYGLERSVIVQCFTIADLRPAKAAGCKIAFLASTWNANDLANMQADNVDYYAYNYLDASFTAARLQAIYDAGIALAPWTLDRRSQAVAEAARVGRPLAWVASTYGTFTGGLISRSTADPFRGMVPSRGQIPSGANRGVFSRQDKLSIINGATVWQGWASTDSVTTNRAWQQVCSYETLGASSTAGVYIMFGMQDDQSNTPGVSPQGGYHLRISPNGLWQCWRVLASATTSLGSFTRTGGAYSAGDPMTAKVEFIGTSVKVTCVETGQTIGPVVDNTYRGGHLAYGNSAGDCEVSFKTVTVT